MPFGLPSESAFGFAGILTEEFENDGSVSSALLKAIKRCAPQKFGPTFKLP